MYSTKNACRSGIQIPGLILVAFLLILPVNEPMAGDHEIDKHFMAQLELGPVWQGRNDVQIPNNPDGTRFSLPDLVGTGPYPAFRFYLTWRISLRHNLRLLLAPLSYTEGGTFSEPVSFAGQTYVPGQPVDATYKFNSDLRLKYGMPGLNCSKTVFHRKKPTWVLYPCCIYAVNIM